jgi:hypothetical protein
MSLDDGDSLRLSDKFAFFRGNNTDASSGRRDVPLNDLVTLLNDPLVLTSVGASQAEVDNLKTNLAINTLNDVIGEGRTVFQMVDQVSDGFNDETGIDTVTSTNEDYNAAGNYYSPVGGDLATSLLHMDGADGSTTFPDETGNATFTAQGDAQVDTAQSKFGGASALFDGTGDHISTPAATWNALEDADFTLDCWFRVSGTTGLQTFFGRTAAGTSYLFSTNGTSLYFQSYAPQGNHILSGGTVSVDTWHHAAAVRNGLDLQIYLDGVSVASQALASGYTFNTVATDLDIGINGNVYPLTGHIDEWRFLKGTAIWTSGFTPPTQAYDLSSSNMTLVSESFTADTAPTHARLTVLFDPVDAVTLNTDLIFSVSIDDGTTFATATMEYVQDYTADIRILTCDEIDLSGVTSGTEVVIKAVTANEKDLKIHGWVVQWR